MPLCGLLRSGRTQVALEPDGVEVAPAAEAVRAGVRPASSTSYECKSAECRQNLSGDRQVQSAWHV